MFIFLFFFSSSIFQLFLENTFWFIFQKLFDTPPLSLIHFPFQGLETGCNNRKYLAIPLPPLQNLFLIKKQQQQQKEKEKQTNKRKKEKEANYNFKNKNNNICYNNDNNQKRESATRK